MDNRLLNIVFGLLLTSIVSEYFSRIGQKPAEFSVVMAMMVYLAFMKHKHLDSNLLRVFYQDGVFYFILLSGGRFSGTTLSLGTHLPISGFAIASIIINTSAPVSLLPLVSFTSASDVLT